MFTIEQIKAAHANVKSGADFPTYIQTIALLGVTGYETFVEDGHTIFHGHNNFSIAWEAKYAPLVIADKSDDTQFQHELREHQRGKTDYPTFCKRSAALGVEKWVVSIDAMTCTYYDKEGRAMLQEIIPS